MLLSIATTFVAGLARSSHGAPPPAPSPSRCLDRGDGRSPGKHITRRENEGTLTESRTAGAMVIGALAAVTFMYAGNSRDRLAFAEAAVRGSPHAALAHRNLALTYQLAGQTARARAEYQAAIAANAGEPIVHNNLAVLLMPEGRLPEAAAELRAEIAVNPDYAIAHDDLARVLRALGRADEAATEEAIAARQRGGGR